MPVPCMKLARRAPVPHQQPRESFLVFLHRAWGSHMLLFCCLSKKDSGRIVERQGLFGYFRQWTKQLEPTPRTGPGVPGSRDAASTMSEWDVREWKEGVVVLGV